MQRRRQIGGRSCCCVTLKDLPEYGGVLVSAARQQETLTPVVKEELVQKQFLHKWLAVRCSSMPHDYGATVEGE